MHDAVVVGGGPAGLSAATWLGRHRRRAVVLDSGEHRNRWVEHSHGYLSRDAVNPRQLLDVARRELGEYGTVEVRNGEARSARSNGGGTFTVETDDGDVEARRLVLATGVVDRFPEVDGFFEHYGASVFHCPTCDGYEAQDRSVVVFGWSEAVAGFALGLLDWAGRVTVVTDGSAFEGDDACRTALSGHQIDLLEEDAVALLGVRGELGGVRLASGHTLECELAFFSIAHEPRNQLASALGCELTDEGCVVVDESGQTSVEGVYAAGDLTPGIQLVQVAAAKGTVAGVKAALSLRGEPAASEAPTPGPDPEAEIGRERR